ncbi:UNVERIFIED_CONTAM: hypothetical protein PYX00_010123 [Menopon gallinae]|uniref:Sushi domain-containing protein n=1 Tax=Menopon gallinae TaxID=328185 RepID=A0AAW2HEV8_9NEOP
MVRCGLSAEQVGQKVFDILLVTFTVLLHREGMGHPCGFPGRPRNGSSSTLSTISRPGDTAQYSCRPGYTLFGDTERVCLESGIWAGQQPLCELNLVLKRPTLMSAQLWHYTPDLAVDGNTETCSFTPKTSEQRWWQVDLTYQQHIGSVALVISRDAYHELTIFITELVSKNQALYKPCTHFKGKFPKLKMLFVCNKGKGHKGRYVYIRDDRKNHDYFGLCEVEVFAFRGGWDTYVLGGGETEANALKIRGGRGRIEKTCRNMCSTRVFASPTGKSLVPRNWVTVAFDASCCGGRDVKPPS